MTIFTIIAAILIFSVIIFVHELGHFLTARIFGVTVHEFAVGMGPALWKKQGKETLYSIRAIPMGGFCQLEGEDDDSEAEGSFRKKKPIPRIVILAAGATMNLLLGFIVVLCLTGISAVQNGAIPSTKVESVMAESSLAEFLQPGDKIVAVNGDAVHIHRDLSFALSRSGEKEATVTIRRGNETLTHAFTPIEKTFEDGSKGYLIGFQVTLEHPTLLGILHESWFQTVWMVKLVFVSLGELISGKAAVSDLSGPVGVVGAMTQVAKTGWLELLFFAAFLTVNIGLMNLLPLPALDGGRILFVVLELLFGKPVPADKEGWVHFGGLVLLLLLMLYATWNDILRLFFQ